MNKKIMTAISVVLAMGMFALGVEGLTRYRLDIIKVPVLKERKTDREMIEKDDLVYLSFPRKYIHDATVLDKDDLVDVYIKLNHTLFPNTPILSESIEYLDMAHDDAVLRLLEGQSVYAIKSDLKESFGGILNVGHRIDLSFVNRENRTDISAQTFLKQVRVIGAKNKKGENVSHSDVPAVILLAINDESLETLIELEAKGNLIMTLVEKSGDGECIEVKDFKYE